MRFPWRYLGGIALGVALVALPLWILTSDPDSKLQALRTPLCRNGMTVTLENVKGGAFLLQPSSGLRVNATVDGVLMPAHFLLYKHEPGGDWHFYWALDAANGQEYYYLPQVADGLSVYVRAIDPTGARCPADSPTLTTVSA